MQCFLGLGPLADPTGARAAAVMIKYAAPETVTEENPDDLFDVPKVAVNFADRDYQYPTHTASAAWVSAAMYHDTGSTDPVVGNRIKLACDFHRLSSEWERLERVTKVAREKRTKKASAGRWAMPAIRKYPLDTRDQVKLAGDYFARHADAFAEADRRTFAAETAKAASVLGWSGSAQALRLLEAEGGLCRPAANPTRPFTTRAKYAADCRLDALAVALTKAAEGAGADPVADAAVLRQVDKRAGWDFGNPIFETTGETYTEVREKIASAARALSGNWYAVDDLKQIPPTFLSAAFGTGPVVAEPTLRGLLTDTVKSAAFEKILQDAGVRPVAKAPAPRADWKKLAQASS